MTRAELKDLISEYDKFIELFKHSQFVVDGKAARIRAILEELTHDELLIPEKDA